MILSPTAGTGYEDPVAYDHKYENVYHGKHLALFEMASEIDDMNRSVENPYDSFTESEKYALWKFARTRNIVPEQTSIPSDVLVWYGLKHDFLEPEELDHWSDDDSDKADDADGDDSDDEDMVTIDDPKLPYEVYVEVLEAIVCVITATSCGGHRCCWKCSLA